MNSVLFLCNMRRIDKIYTFKNYNFIIIYKNIIPYGNWVKSLAILLLELCTNKKF